MKERIIVVPGAGGTELSGTLAGLGVNTIGTRVVSGGQLAEIALMRSGISLTDPFLTRSEDVAVIYSILREHARSEDPEFEYFKQSGTIEDAMALARTITILRGLCTGDETAEIAEGLAGGEFRDKNDALTAICKARAEIVKSRGKADTIDRIRAALDQAEPFDAEFVTLKEYPLTPLTEALVQKLSAGTATEISLADLAEGKQFPVRNKGIVSITKAYGAVNEVEDIIDTIYQNQDIEPDMCTIACAASSEYAQLIYDIARQHNVPVTFGTGVPITNARPAELLRLIMFWDGPGLHGADALRAILKSASFDRKTLDETLGTQVYNNSKGEEKEVHCFGYLEDLAKMAGRLQLSFDSAANKKRIDAYVKLETVRIAEEKEKDASAKRRAVRREIVLNWLPAFAEELSSGMVAFFDKYALTRKGPDYEKALDLAAKAAITETLETYSDYLDPANMEDISKSILRRMICPQSSKGGCLHVTDIKGAMMALRENLFVCGLSASNYPGRPVENHLLLDSDLERFGSGGRSYQSAEIIRQRTKDFNGLISLAEASGACIRLSYSSFNIAELKKANPSSVIFGYRGDSDAEIGFFDSSLLKYRFVGRAYKELKPIDFKAADADDFFEDIDEKALLDRYWAATDIEEFLNCPRKFCFEKVLDIREEEEDDPLTLMESYATGNLAHGLMEKLAAHGRADVTREQFLQWAADAFDNYFLERIPVSMDAMEDEKQRFLEMMAEAFEWEQKSAGDREVLSAEDEYRFEHPEGIRVKGYPDRVEKTADGKYIIKDFKTKRSIEHKKNDFASCIQAIVYAWLYKQGLAEKGIHDSVIAAEYIYLRQGETIPCRYDQDTEEQLAQLLGNMKDAILQHNFKRGTAKPDPRNSLCKYCDYMELCLNWPEEENQSAAKKPEVRR